MFSLAAVDIDWGKLLEAAYVSAAFALAVMLIAALGVVASLRAQDRKSEHSGVSAVGLNVVTAICVLLIAAAIVFGIYIMTQK